MLKVMKVLAFNGLTGIAEDQDGITHTFDLAQVCSIDVSNLSVGRSVLFLEDGYSELVNKHDTLDKA